MSRTQDHRVRANAYFVLDGRIAFIFREPVVTDTIATTRVNAVKRVLLANVRPGANYQTPAVIDGEPGPDWGAARWQVNARACAGDAV